MDEKQKMLEQLGMRRENAEKVAKMMRTLETGFVDQMEQINFDDNLETTTSACDVKIELR